MCHMDFRQLRYLISAAEHGSFRKAAASLHVEQSAISRHIRDLEIRLGTPLFIRSHSGVSLTDQGKIFVENIRRGLDQIRSAAELVTAASGNTIRIGLRSSLGNGCLAEILQRFGETRGGVQQEILEGNVEDHIAALLANQLDIAFLAGSVDAPHCHAIDLWKERLFVACPKAHPLARCSSISPESLSTERLMLSEREFGSEIFAFLKGVGAGVAISRATLCMTGRETLMSLVGLKHGFTLVTEANTSAIFPNIVYRPLAVSDPYLSFKAVWAHSNRNPAVRHFLNIAKSVARDDRHGRPRLRSNGETRLRTQGASA
ncbi:LysR family transcriptional regulator [Brucella endophytica]|uniref:LysR family transcriptional regulator n=2 Tax=Brucella endophytica TaxID=1963359 RepID=A0A916ST97_9HYPH|nr:LysR family transcriptional regulator [Brucella endophytica]GGB12250.1 LysR family transcriptional regulator [Brucella endophytica]